MNKLPPAFKYEQVMAQLRGLIDQGLPRGSRLPPERELSESLGVGRLTVRRALQAMEDAGEVKRVQGSGTFVTGPAVEHGQVIRSFTDEMIARGSVPGAIVLSCHVRPASAEAAWALMITPGEDVVELVRLRTADRLPMCIETTRLPAARVPGLEQTDLTASLYGLLRERYGIRIASVLQELRATVVDQEEAALLKIAAHSPALAVKHTSSDADGHPIEFAESIYRGDRYTVHMELKAGE